MCGKELTFFFFFSLTLSLSLSSMFNSPSFAFQEVRAAILLVILLLWVGYFFVLRRFSTGVIILAVGLAICAQHAQGPDVDKHLTCVGTALVVGVSHGGIGLPTAKLLAERGCKVILAGRSIDRLRAAEAEIRESVPSLQSLVFEVDLANFSSVSAFADELMEQINVIEYLVLNAGIMFEGHLTNDGLNAISQVKFIEYQYLFPIFFFFFSRSIICRPFISRKCCFRSCCECRIIVLGSWSLLQAQHWWLLLSRLIG